MANQSRALRNWTARFLSQVLKSGRARYKREKKGAPYLPQAAAFIGCASTVLAAGALFDARAYGDAFSHRHAHLRQRPLRVRASVAVPFCTHTHVRGGALCALTKRCFMLPLQRCGKSHSSVTSVPPILKAANDRDSGCEVIGLCYPKPLKPLLSAVPWVKVIWRACEWRTGRFISSSLFSSPKNGPLGSSVYGRSEWFFKNATKTCNGRRPFAACVVRSPHLRRRRRRSPCSRHHGHVSVVT